MHVEKALVCALALALSLGACRDDGDDGGGNKDTSVGEGGVNSDGGGGGDSATIYQIMDGTIAEGDTVLLRDVIVTAVDTHGEYADDIFVQEAEGGKGSAIKVYRPQRIDGGEISDLKPGDHVKVEGVVKYFTPTGGFNDDAHPDKQHIVELDQGTQVSYLGENTPLDPEELTIDQLTDDPDAAGWEFVLVKLSNVAVNQGVHPEYAEFKVTDGTSTMEVADDLYLHNPGIGDCVSLVGISNYFFGYKLLLRGAEDVQSGTGCPEPLDVTIKDLQDDTSANHPESDSWVKLSGTVSAVDSLASGSSSRYYGFWVQQDGGGAQSGIYVYYYWEDDTPDELKPKLNEKIDLYGTYVEHRYSSSERPDTLSEIKYPAWVNNGQASTPPQATVVSAADVATDGGQSQTYEGVLITVENVEVESYVEDSNNVKVGLKLAGSGLIVDRELFDFLGDDPPAVGTQYQSITGPLHYSYDEYRILPRSAADLVE